MYGHRVRCENGGGALLSPRGLYLPGGPDGGNRYVLPPRRMRRPIPAY